jgi:hypothetical protein
MPLTQESAPIIGHEQLTVLLKTGWYWPTAALLIVAFEQEHWAVQVSPSKTMTQSESVLHDWS